MKEILMREHFGPFLADGDLGNKFRFCEIDPLFGSLDLIIIDFQGVTNMSDSFANACFGSLAEDHPQAIVEKVRFRNCIPGIKQSLVAAINCGIRQSKRISR
jgi:STAS-like domain of unknown function (DUF4325)